MRPVTIAHLPRRCLLVAATACALFGLPAVAQAGRLVVTGHDAEHHCSRGAAGERGGSCHFVNASVSYVRGGAPDPNKPVLVLDRGFLDFRAALVRAFPGVTVPTQFADPRSPEFLALPLSTDAYSAILVASSKDGSDDPTPQDLDEFGSTPDTDAINDRTGDIAAFFDHGGGLLVMSGGSAARDDSAGFYHFINITRGGGAVTAPFSLTGLGRAAGFQDARAFPGESNDVNCCRTHLSYERPAPESSLKVAEEDKVGRAVTMLAETSSLASIEEPSVDPGTVFTPLDDSNGGQGGSNGKRGGGRSKRFACVPKRSLRVSLKRPRGVRFARATVYVNGKRVKQVSGKRLGTRRRTRAFKVKLSQKRVSKVRIVVVTATGRQITFRKTYKPC